MEALTRLIKYITVTPVANEHLWQNILTTITRNIRKDPQNLIISAIPNGVDLQKFLSKFFNDSLHVYGIGTGFGPTGRFGSRMNEVIRVMFLALEHMGMFLSRLLASDGGNGKILEQYVDCLNTLFVNPGPNTLGALPIETLSAIVDIVGQGMNALSKNNTCGEFILIFVFFKKKYSFCRCPENQFVTISSCDNDATCISTFQWNFENQ